MRRELGELGEGWVGLWAHLKHESAHDLVRITKVTFLMKTAEPSDATLHCHKDPTLGMALGFQDWIW